MIAPHELNNKEFTRTLRGYSTTEVDEYVEKLKESYLELYRHSSELEKRIGIIMAKNNELSKDSDTVRTALIDAQKAAAKIVDEAKDEAAIIIASSKVSCDNALNEFRFRIGEERDKLIALQNEIKSFKAQLFSQYQSHIDSVEKITDEANWSGLDFDEEEYAKRVVSDIKTDVAYMMAELRQRRESASDSKLGDEYFENRDVVLEGDDVYADDQSETIAANDGSDTLVFEPGFTPEPAELEPQSRLDEPAEPEEDSVDASQEYDSILEKFAEEIKEEESAGGLDSDDGDL